MLRHPYVSATALCNITQILMADVYILKVEALNNSNTVYSQFITTVVESKNKKVLETAWIN